ncbi:MAG TPA: tRNA (adenosine(37)-N6)-threonylcarbamoyltransferase complex transferase subunit TsaD [Bacteroidales bacterium]|jgi:N6-L-threonylcarbamoyladenine synthase|nr:tRNA (adenosine(37)-N6)-threonylcarbamoyltransferase complex transferase subunit TsaD [Bacteroidales bacterium]NLD63677.1 tRNA (adenosine(37)-N6)-threonylcarbamoyltransferase complex transferase subunit TsaD [Bacteroidales bacterium]HNT92289.1 tRNA (adenosine(37)-N6)-threonylcarbamoyltransferase complex transferase subunit TsaD [Bacteroidales bacterium]HPE22268.1 tRNA (adenosine(37)-N6)-threonylcarbamoyltransferase complex transferase subunit TsaD [Bacteroidales bacterium]HRW25970.1 tRNA (ad
MAPEITILAIESSCDDTSAAVICDGFVLSNLIANQEVHREYGGVVPELASRAHQANIVPVVDRALVAAGKKAEDISAVAFTRGPGLLGSLLVGTSFAKGFALARNIPLIEVNHLQAHVMSHFAMEQGRENRIPGFPFLCLLVSGGHTQLIVIRDYLSMELIGNTIDDAAGEAFDKCAKVMGLPYPGGPVIDRMAADGNPFAFSFAKPRIPGLNFSFSGLKTSFLYFLRDRVGEDPDFIGKNINDLAASLQRTIIEILMAKLVRASKETGIREIGIAGGVSANKGLRQAASREAARRQWNLFLPELRYTTDNAAMIGITGYYKYLRSEFTDHSVVPAARIDT